MKKTQTPGLIPISKPYLVITPSDEKYTNISLSLSGIEQISHPRSIVILFCAKCLKSLQKQTVIRMKVKQAEELVKQPKKPKKRGRKSASSKALKKQQIPQQQSQQLNFCVTCFIERTKQIKIAIKKQFQQQHQQQQQLHQQQQQQQLNYTVYQKLQFPIITGNWSLNYELTLLNAISKYGHNWQQIQQQMKYSGANYRIQQLQMHYQMFYPSINQPKIVFDEELIKKRQIDPSYKYSNVQNPYAFSINNISRSNNNDYSSSQTDQIMYYYEKSAMKIVLNSQQIAIEEYITDLQFFEEEDDEEYQQTMYNTNNDNKNNDNKEESQNKIRKVSLKKQEQLIKQRILHQYNILLKQRYQKQKLIMKFQPYKLVNTQRLQISIKDNITFYQQLYSEQIQNTLTSGSFLLENAISLASKLMRFINKQELYHIIKAINFSFRIQELMQAFQRLQKQQNLSTKNMKGNNQTTVQSYFKVLSKKSNTNLFQEQLQEIQQKNQPRKLVNLDSKGSKGSKGKDKKMQQPKQLMTKNQKLLIKLGFKSQTELIQYCHSDSNRRIDKEDINKHTQLKIRKITI